MSKDKIVLSYGDSLLKQSDVRLLDDGEWLNDKIIGFVFEYFEKEKFEASDKRLCFVQPTVAHFLKLAEGQDEIKIFIAPLDLENKDLIFIPLNDNEDEESAGGSHWSLLVYYKDEMKFIHLDSCRGCNKRQAISMKKKLQQHLKDSFGAELIQPSCPQQKNGKPHFGYDCGMYLVCFVDEICKSIQKKQAQFEFNFDDTDVKRARRSIEDTICKLSEKFS